SLPKSLGALHAASSRSPDRRGRSHRRVRGMAAAMKHADTPLLQAIHLAKHYAAGRRVPWRARRTLHAVNGVDFSIGHGETLGLVGESGCGKTTLGRLVLGLAQPTTGRVLFQGEPIADQRGRAWRRSLQMIFQDPLEALDPRMKIGAQIGEVLAVHGICPPAERRAVAAQLLARGGISGPSGPDWFAH